MYVRCVGKVGSGVVEVSGGWRVRGGATPSPTVASERVPSVRCQGSSSTRNGGGGWPLSTDSRAEGRERVATAIEGVSGNLACMTERWRLTLRR